MESNAMALTGKDHLLVIIFTINIRDWKLMERQKRETPSTLHNGVTIANIKDKRKIIDLRSVISLTPTILALNHKNIIPEWN